MQLRGKTMVRYCTVMSIIFCLFIAGITVSSCAKRAEVMTPQPVDLQKCLGVYAGDITNGPFVRIYVKEGKLIAEYEDNVITFVHTEGHKFRMDGGPLDNGIVEFIPDGKDSFSALDAEGIVLTRVKEK
ncbi:MAG: hypothetical protein HOC71_10170 [Candidatus Latescibacteria bacterium]|nr:hypothetical protein [Candidatus Latescibacterota bacterium]